MSDLELITGVPVALGGPRGMAVTRTLPSRGRRMVGAWCFLDAYGPVELATAPTASGASGMRVGPHPHTGLQTVSWLLAGEVLHRDSLGSLQLVEPGQLNLMTAGRGISHSEETPADHSPTLHGVQLWVALPDDARHLPPAFEHHGDLPVLDASGARLTVIMGELAGAMAGERSPAPVHSPIVGAQVELPAGVTTSVPLDPDFEHAVMVLDGRAEVGARGGDVDLETGPLLYLGSGRRELRLGSPTGAVVLLLGGTPFEEQLVMWWNFVGRDHEEIVQDRLDWEAQARRFGVVHGYAGGRLAAPALPSTRLRPRGRVR